MFVSQITLSYVATFMSQSIMANIHGLNGRGTRAKKLQNHLFCRERTVENHDNRKMNKLDQQKEKVEVTNMNRRSETVFWHMQITFWQRYVFVVYEPVCYFNMTQSNCFGIIYWLFIPLSLIHLVYSREVFLFKSFHEMFDKP